MSRAHMRPDMWRDETNDQMPVHTAGPVGRSQKHRLWLASGLTSVTLLSLLLVLAGRPQQTTAQLSGIPQEVIGPNRVVMRNYPDRAWLSYYKSNAGWVGEPLWGERPFDIWASCYGFQNSVVCHNTDPAVVGSVWEYLPQPLGTRSLMSGQVPNPRAELAPIVQDYIALLQRKGEDHWYRLGAVQAPAYCPEGDGDCYQVFQLQVLRWSKSSTDPSDVRISQLGASFAAVP